MPSNKSPYRLTISLNVLEHLGINLYSNVPAVLAEIVANAWDADATEVTVDWLDNPQSLVIKDNGSGMNQDAINERFLTVGYRRRDDQPGLTPSRRKPMGRKGIGKLSVFAIANTVTVESCTETSKDAFSMELDDIRKSIKKKSPEGEGEYFPTPISTEKIDWSHGTRITLTNLKKLQSANSPRYLQKRLARKFSIIGPQNDFQIFVNGNEIEPADRGYYQQLQFLWLFGEQEEVDSLSTRAEVFKNPAHVTSSGGTITGWLGTVFESKQLKDDDEENINHIALMIRGKVAQDDVLQTLAERGVYASYLIGELNYDHLDLYDGEGEEDPDAAVSSRQQIVEDDERFRDLITFLQSQLKTIGSRWTDLRTDAGARTANDDPAIAEWIQSIPASNRTQAKQWIGRLNRLRVDSEEERVELIRHSILAYEFHMSNENLERLESISDENLPAALELFGELDDLELSLYGQIVRQRIKVIATLEEKLEQNALEKAIQEYIFDHLWLLDPSWERAEGTEFIETRIDGLFKDIDATLSAEQRAARLDIGYRLSAGKFIVVELKRPERTLGLTEIVDQLTKYRLGLDSLFEQARMTEPREFVVIVGRRIREMSSPTGSDYVSQMLESIPARVVYYEELLATAKRTYREYLSEHKRKSRLDRILADIGVPLESLQ